MPILRAGPFGSVNDITQRYFQDEPDDPTGEIVPINCANKTTTRWVWGLHAFADGTINEEGDIRVDVDEYQFGGSGQVQSNGGDFGSFAQISFMYQATEEWSMNGTVTDTDGYSCFFRQGNNSGFIPWNEPDISKLVFPVSGAVPVWIRISNTSLTFEEVTIDYDIN
jgi:hypothetical protein